MPKLTKQELEELIRQIVRDELKAKPQKTEKTEKLEIEEPDEEELDKELEEFLEAWEKRKQKPKEEMEKCPVCGNEIAKNTPRCPHCNVELEWR